MTEPYERLQKAREAAGYATATDAARAMHIPSTTYLGHENGSRPAPKAMQRYARFFRVSLDWLLSGKGQMRGTARTIPVVGLVGAGAAVEMIGDTSGHDAPDEIEMLGNGKLAALQVRGDSQYPRFLSGEFVLFEFEPTSPASLINQYAVVQTVDGRRLIKMLRRGKAENRWQLESHNAPPEEDVELIGAWRYLGTLPAR